MFSSFRMYGSPIPLAGQILTLALLPPKTTKTPATAAAGNLISSQHSLHITLPRFSTGFVFRTRAGRGEFVLCFVFVFSVLCLSFVFRTGALWWCTLVGRGEGVLPKYKHRSIVRPARTHPSQGQMATRPPQIKGVFAQKSDKDISQE